MKTKLSRIEAHEKINDFFKREKFNTEDLRKIKRLAMKFKIKLGKLRQVFCKRCLSQLKGKIIISKIHKTVECKNCGFRNKFRLS